MTARELEESAARLSGLRWAARDNALASALAVALAAPAWLAASALGVAVGIGAAVAAARAALAVSRRRLLLQRLSLTPAALVIPAVGAYAERLTSQRSRAELAKSIRAMLRDAFRPASRLSCLFLVDRVAAHARELEAIARALASPRVKADPVAVARCRWLLTESHSNPLYDRTLPPEELASILRRIQAGFEPAERT